MNPGIYRQRPVTVEAMPVSLEHEGDIIRWGNGYIYSLYPGASEPYLIITTKNGKAVAYDGSYIVRKASGDFTVVPSAEFTGTYEPVVEVGHD